MRRCSRALWVRTETTAFAAIVATGCLIALSLWPQGTAAQTQDPEPTAVALAQSFPTLFADATPAGPIDPHLGGLSTSGTFPILAGGQDVGMQASISTDPATGATFSTGDETYGIAATGPASAGVASDNTVIFYRPDGTTSGFRPTGDGGTEIAEVLPPTQTSTTYRLVIPSGTELVKLATGEIAVVRRSAPPVPEIGAAAEQLADAEQTIVDAAVDASDDAEEELASEDELETAAVENDGPDVVGDVVEDGPTDPEVAEEDGSLPAYLREDATTAELAEDVTELEGDLPSDALTADEQEQIELAADGVEIAELAAGAQDQAEEAAVNAAESAELNALLDEDLAEGRRAEDVEEVAAELDIGDAAAEADRTATSFITAQREIGPDDRVEAIFAAPLTKTTSGAPIVTSLEVTGPDEVTVHVPEGLEEAVVVDPFFAIAVVFVVRIAVQRVAPVIARAAVRYATRAFSQTATRLAQAADRARKLQLAARAHAQALRQAAQRRWLQVRAWAAAQARARRVADLARQKRLRDQAERARRLGQQQRAKKQDAARRLAAKARESKPPARVRVQERVAKTAQRALEPIRKAVEAGAKQAMTTWRERQLVLEETIRLIRAQMTTYPLTPGARLLVELGLDKLGGVLLDNNHCMEFAATGAHLDVKGHQWIGHLFALKDLMGCVEDVLGDPAEQDHGDRLASIRVIADAYEQAQSTALTRAPSFQLAPAATPIGASVLGTTVPSSITAGKPAFVQIAARNSGPELPLATTHIDVPGGFPYLTWGDAGSSARVRLTDENGDGRWSHGELANAVVETHPPLMQSRTVTVSYGFITGTTTFSTGRTLTLNIVAPPDVSAPTKPTSLRKTAATTSSITMAWNASTDNMGVSGYSVYRSGTRITKVASTSYKFTGLACGKSYTLGVSAYDAAGNSSSVASFTAATAACPRVVTVTKGGSAQGKPGCSSSYCRYLQVSFSNFSSATHTIVCRASNGDEGGFYTYTRSGTSNTSAVCYYGFPGRTVWVTVDGVSSNKIGW